MQSELFQDKAAGWAAGPLSASAVLRLTESLRAVYPGDWLDEIMGVAARTQGSEHVAVLRFLDWLRQAKPGTAGHNLYVKRSSIQKEAFHARVFHDAIKEWLEDWKEHPLVKAPRVVPSGVRAAMNLMAKIAGRVSIVPSGFSASNVRISGWVPAESSSTPSLGELGWPELDPLFGVQRERAALRIVRQRCAQAFLEEEGVHERAQMILSGRCPEGVPEDVCCQIQSLLRALKAELRSSGNLNFMRIGPKFKMHPGASSHLWKLAGFRGKRMIPLQGVCQSAFIPTPRMRAAAIGVLVCDTGWNVQPICDLSSDPFIFRSAKKAYVATPAFIESFKARAGHHVTAYLGDGETLSGRALDTATTIWDELRQAENPEDSQCAELECTPDGDLTSIEIMSRYRKIAQVALSEVEGEPWAVELKSSFWIQDGSERLKKAERCKLAEAGSDFDGVTYRAIRKSVTQIRLDESGSIRATARSVGHHSSGVIMPHYLNAPHIVTELDRKIRQFQDMLQSLLTRDLDQVKVANVLGVSCEDLAKSRVEAERAGIASALGLIEVVECDVGKALWRLKFDGSKDSMAELYLAHRALQGVRRRTKNHARFRITFMPMLAMVKAIGRQLSAAGLRRKYWEVARSTALDLRNGKVILPFIGE